MSIIPETVSPRELAKSLGWPEAFIRKTARELGACLGSGRGMRLTEADVIKIMEARRKKASSTTTTGRLPDIGAAELVARLTEKKPRELRPRSTYKPSAKPPTDKPDRAKD